ncbi:MAG TPA: hypothetical protein VGP33_13300 [Chloroflexota bacterium]|jgi:hypothetical protein|nr:hypothetical protein [Chloroflexota bacterium]
MRRFSTAPVLRCAVVLLVAAPFLTGVPAAEAARCRYVLGFQALHHRIASVIGACLGDEQHNPVNGDAYQQTKRGTLVWRKADNQVVFTNGYVTILNGPQGLEQRLNAQRFPWEGNPDGLLVVADAPTTAAQLRRQFATASPARVVTCTTSTSSSLVRAHRSTRKGVRKVAPRPKTTVPRPTCT